MRRRLHAFRSLVARQSAVVACMQLRPPTRTLGQLQPRIRRTAGILFVASMLLSAHSATASPTLTVNGASAPDTMHLTPGTTVTLAISAGPGTAKDWIGLFPAGATTNNAYVDWWWWNGTKTVPTSGSASSSFSVALPSAPGGYEYRFFPDNTFNAIATSATVAVSNAQLSVNGSTPPTTLTASAGTTVTVNLSGGIGLATDWIGLYPVGASNLGYLDRFFVGGSKTPAANGQTSASIPFVLPMTNGVTYEFRFFTNSSYLLFASSTTVETIGAILTVNGIAPATSVSAPSGSSVDVGVFNGPRNATDWVGLYRVTSADTQFLEWKYLNGTQTPPASGISSATVSFNLPAGAGSYQFRLFASGGWTRLATSTTVVTLSQLTVNGGTVYIEVPGLHAVTVGLAGGPGNTNDWVGLYEVGAGQAQYLSWQFLNGTQTVPASGTSTATLSFLMPAATSQTVKRYEFRVFANGGAYQYVGVSSAVGVNVAEPSVTLSTTSCGGCSTKSGAPIDVSFSNGPANTTDWIGLFTVGSPDTSFLEWFYTNGSRTPPADGIGSGTIQFLAPAVSGSYEFRLFANNAFTRVTTSAEAPVTNTSQVTVNGHLPNQPLSLDPGAQLTVTVAGGPANRGDWVGVFTTADEQAFTDWTYMNGLHTRPAIGISDATLPLTMPTTVSADRTYQVRFYALNSANVYGTKIATSAPISPICDVSLSPLSTTFAATGGSATVTVSARPRCAWTVMPNVPWITITGAINGTASGSTAFTVASNPTADSRSATLTIGGVALQINQARSCIASISSTNVSVAASGGSGTLALTTPSDCPWTTAANVSWISVQPTNGTGPATLTYTLPTNPTAAVRQGTITVGTTLITLTQPGACPILPGPTMDPAQGTYAGTSPTAIYLSSNLTGASLRYTLDGTDPTEASIAYSGPFLLYPPSTVVVKARAFVNQCPTTVTTSTYALYLSNTSAPTVTPSSGTYDGPFTASVTTNMSGGLTRYTTDGTEPTDASAAYTSPIVIDAPITLKFKTFKDGAQPSDTIVASYQVRVAKVAVSPDGGFVDPTRLPLVTLSTTTPSATIRYTVDGTDPTEQSAPYPGPFLAPVDRAVTARAYRNGWIASETATAVFLDGSVGVPSSPVVIAASAAGQFKATGSSITLSANNGTLWTEPGTAKVYVNRKALPDSSITISPNEVSAAGAVVNGRNDLIVEAFDADGAEVHSQLTLWGGSHSMTVNVTNANGVSLPYAEVWIAPKEDVISAVSALADGNGRVTFSNLPSQVLLNVWAGMDGYRPCAKQLLLSGSDSAQCALDLDNNNFQFGTQEWAVTSGNAALVTWVYHSEASPPLGPCSDCTPRAAGPALLEEQMLIGTPAPSSDADLFVHTKNLAAGLGEQVVRRFVISPGTTAITVRYRFQTAEFMSSTPRNDSFCVVIQTEVAGGQAVDCQDVFGLAWRGQIDGNGATPWYSLTLPVVRAEEAVRVTVTAWNAVDRSYGSAVYVDVVKETNYRISAVQLRDLHRKAAQVQEDNKLRFLSISSHNSYSGFTRVYGTVEILGAPNDRLKSLTLEILNQTTGALYPVAGRLATTSGIDESGLSASDLLLRPFTDGRVAVDVSRLLFEIPSADLQYWISQNTDGNLRLRLKAETEFGYKFTSDDNPVLPQIVVIPLGRYTGFNRYGTESHDSADCEIPANWDPGRKPQYWRPPYPCGGDAWTRPSLISLISQITSVTWNDFSNMNGGPFPIHAGHQQGLDVDGLFNGYTRLDAAAARTLVAIIDQTNAILANTAWRLDKVWVTDCGASAITWKWKYCLKNPSTEFFSMLQTLKLADGVTPATKAVKPQDGHSDHFHFMFAQKQ